jgi:hypothetical protein
MSCWIAVVPLKPPTLQIPTLLAVPQLGLFPYTTSTVLPKALSWPLRCGWHMMECSGFVKCIKFSDARYMPNAMPLCFLEHQKDTILCHTKYKTPKGPLCQSCLSATGILLDNLSEKSTLFHSLFSQQYVSSSLELFFLLLLPLHPMPSSGSCPAS